MIIRSLFSVILIGIFTIAFFVFAGTSCSERSKASFEVLKSKAEDELVNAVGKGDVALQLYRTRHEEIAANLVNIKANIRTIERKLNDPRATNSDPDVAARMEATYHTNLERLRDAEANTERLLIDSKARYEELRQTVGILQEQISLARSMKDIGMLGEGGNLSGEVNSLIDSMERELDAAEAALDVRILNVDL